MAGPDSTTHHRALEIWYWPDGLHQLHRHGRWAMRKLYQRRRKCALLVGGVQPLMPTPLASRSTTTTEMGHLPGGRRLLQLGQRKLDMAPEVEFRIVVSPIIRGTQETASARSLLPSSSDLARATL